MDARSSYLYALQSTNLQLILETMAGRRKVIVERTKVYMCNLTDTIWLNSLFGGPSGPVYIVCSVHLPQYYSIKWINKYLGKKYI